MRIGDDPHDVLKVGDKVTLRMEGRAGLGEILRKAKYRSHDAELYWCVFPGRSDGYFMRDDLMCQRLDGPSDATFKHRKEDEALT